MPSVCPRVHLAWRGRRGGTAARGDQNGPQREAKTNQFNETQQEDFAAKHQRNEERNKEALNEMLFVTSSDVLTIFPRLRPRSYTIERLEFNMAFPVDLLLSTYSV